MTNHNAAPYPDGRESIQSEKSLLRQIQADQARLLERSGVLDIARQELVYRHDATRNWRSPLDTSEPMRADGRAGERVSVCRVAVMPRGAEDPIVEVPALLFRRDTDEPDSDWLYSGVMPVQYVPVGEFSGGEMRPAPGFGDADLEQVERMLHGLEQARDMGVLPHLNGNLATIYDPEYAVMARPSGE